MFRDFGDNNIKVKSQFKWKLLSVFWKFRNIDLVKFELLFGRVFYLQTICAIWMKVDEIRQQSLAISFRDRCRFRPNINISKRSVAWCGWLKEILFTGAYFLLTLSQFSNVAIYPKEKVSQFIWNFSKKNLFWYSLN